MKKTDLVRFRCTPEERKMIEDHARNDGLNLSEYILKLVKEDQNRRIRIAYMGEHPDLMDSDEDGCPFL